MRCYISEIRRPRPEIVEFLFALNDPELGLEMVLPQGPFEAFCRERGINPETGGQGWQVTGATGSPGDHNNP